MASLYAPPFVTPLFDAALVPLVRTLAVEKCTWSSILIAFWPDRWYRSGMVGETQRDTSLFFRSLVLQLGLPPNKQLAQIDAILDDPAILSWAEQALGCRAPNSRKTGRKGMAPDRALRSCALKHIKGWSYRDLEEELKHNLAYRQFTRFDGDKIPQYTTFCRTFAQFGDEFTRRVHLTIVERSHSECIAPGRKLRVDSTAVETNIHHPTDSTLLADGMRVLTRIVKRVSEQCAEGAVTVTNQARATKHRVLEIRRAAKVRNEQGAAKLEASYQKLVDMTQAMLNKGMKVVDEIKRDLIPITGDFLVVDACREQLEHYLPLVARVIGQTKARVFGGDTHSPDKVLSIFEPDTCVIRKGKSHKPNEFGRVVRIDEVENGIVSNYDVKDGNPAETADVMPAVLQHTENFGRCPDLLSTDRGLFSAANEKQAKAAGVKRVAIPARGKLSKSRREHQKQRWFKRGQRWRAGIEARISTLKHGFDMYRAMYKGDVGFKRYVGWCVIANNLVSMARVRGKREVENGVSEAAQAAR